MIRKQFLILVTHNHNIIEFLLASKKGSFGSESSSISLTNLNEDISIFENIGKSLQSIISL